MVNDGTASRVASCISTLRQPHNALLLIMFVGLALFYRGSYQLPITLLGLALFALPALLRPDLALLFVPPTALLYMMPKGIWDERFGIRPEGVRFPLHEIVLLVTVGAFVVHLLLSSPRINGKWSATFPSRSEIIARLKPLAPVLLFALAGTAGLLVAFPEGRGNALREWRWLIIEPLLFYGVLRWYLRHPADGSETRYVRLIISSFVLGGALVGGIGLLQYAGVNLAPLLGDEVGFSEDIMFVEGVVRANSVYGHPNNLALAMGRVWPIATMLALAAATFRHRLALLFFVACSLGSIGGMYVAFSKGANLGAIGALAVMVVAQAINEWQSPGRSLQRVVPLLVLLVGFGGLIASGLQIERLSLFGASSSVRLKTWGAALEIVRDHPLVGVGLDQFNRHYQEYIHPSLIATNEQYISHPHNLLLNIWLRVGLIGVAAFGWLLARFYRLVLDWQATANGDRPLFAVRSNAFPVFSPLQIGVAAAMTAALVHGMVDNFYFVTDLAIAFWLLVGVAEAICNRGSEGDCMCVLRAERLPEK